MGNTTRPGWCSNKSTTPTCAPVGNQREFSRWVRTSVNNTWQLSLYCSAVSRWQVGVSPCRWTGLKSPSSWMSWWRCRMSQPTLCSRSSTKSRLSSQEYDALFFYFCLCPNTHTEHQTEGVKKTIPCSTDLVDFHEMLQLPSEGEHDETGCCLVHSVFWVREDFTATPVWCHCHFTEVLTAAVIHRWWRRMWFHETLFFFISLLMNHSIDSQGDTTLFIFSLLKTTTFRLSILWFCSLSPLVLINIVCKRKQRKCIINTYLN